MTLRTILMAQPRWLRRIPLPARLLAWYVVFCGLVYLLQGDMLYHPAALSRTQLDATLRLERSRGHDMALDSTGTAIVATPHRPVRGTAVLFHGNAGHAMHRLSLLSDFESRGYRLVLVEYAGYGWRSGDISERVMVKEGAALYERIRAQTPASEPVILVGESLGTGVAVQVAASAAVPPDKLVLITPYASLQEVAQQSVPLVPAALLMRDTFRSSDFLPRYKGPVSILLAGRDEVLGVETGRKLARVAEKRGRTDVLELSEAGHNTWFDHASAAHWDLMLKI